jgi:Zn-dependent protease with chaperone function
LPNTLRVIGLRHGLQNRLLVVPGDSLFCAGIFKPRIFVGRNLLRDLSREELEAALVHESYHLKQRDPLKILLVSTFSTTFFFLPAVREIAQAYLREKEISADRLAETTVGRKHLSRALIKAFRRGADQAPGVPGFTAGLTSVRKSATFSTWGWGLTVLFIGIGWIAIKSSLSHGGCS